MQHRPHRFLTIAGAAMAGVLLLPAVARAEAPPDPAGTWVTEDGRARVRVEPCGAKPDHICGYVVWMKQPNEDNGQPRRDESNPDHAKRSRLLLGHQLILGLKPNDDGAFEGQIYDAENGKKYDITLRRESADALKVRGCMLAVLCGSQHWAKAAGVIPGQLTGPTNGLAGPRSDPEWTAKPIK